MTAEITTLRQARVFLLALMLFLASTLLGSGAAVADVLNPKEDMGSPGGGGAVVIHTPNIVASTRIHVLEA